mmetsp:Transcript_18721/g.13553  ORF Transcript_18721/g.13553 Transcript_18721/m.13553 type:complete len:131 (+) Transcript_18721:121-513(+)
MQIMPRIEAETKKTFELEEYFFHYINEDGISVLCMTDKTINKKVPFAFMVDLKKALFQQYNAREIENAKAYQLGTFTDVIREKMSQYNENPDQVNSKTEELFKELSGLKDAMIENMDRLIERDGKIEVVL